ncbi:MAG: hypothetical protein IK085_03805 [Clostridia bacterium]|nr:hypothetical protein [Clostridia bacterium]
MNYNDLYKDFISLFPEDKIFFDELCKVMAADEEDGIHIMFAFVVVPFIKKIIKEAPDKAKKAFDFFEEMEKSNDVEIAGVLEATVLENLLTDDKNDFDIYVPFLGKETKEAARAVARWFDVPELS